MKEGTQGKIFEEWLDAHRALLFKVIRAYTTNGADRDDLFQEVCLQVYRSVPIFKGKSAVTTWLYRIALNTAIKWSTKERKHTQGHQELGQAVHLIQATEDATDDRLRWLYQQIRSLNEIDRSLTLLLLDGYSYREMAEIVGISDTNLGVKLYRIKKQLAENAKRYEQDAPGN